MDSIVMWKPESATLVVEDWKPSSATLVDDWKPTSATEVDELSVEPSKLPLLTGEDVPDSYRRLGVTSWRPSTVEDPDYQEYLAKQKTQPDEIKKAQYALQGQPYALMGEREKEGAKAVEGRVWTDEELTNAKQLMEISPEQFTKDDKLALWRAEARTHPWRALPDQIKTIITKGVSMPFGWGEWLAPGLQRELSEEISTIPGYGGPVGEAVSEGVDTFLKFKYIYPILFKAVGFVGKIPYAQKAGQALKKITGLKKLSEVAPRLERLTSTSLAAFPKGAVVGGGVAGIEAYNNGLSWEEAKPLIIRDAAIMGTVATAFNVAGFLDTQMYVNRLRKGMIKATNQKYVGMNKQIAQMPSGPGKTRASKGAAALHRTDLKTIDRIVSEVEGQLIGVKAGKLYQTGQKEFDSPRVAAKKFIQSEGLGRMPGGIEALEKQLVPRQRDILTGEPIRIGRPISPDVVYKAIKAAPKATVPRPVTPSDIEVRTEAEIAGMASELTAVQHTAMAEAKRPPAAPIAPAEKRPVKLVEEIEKPPEVPIIKEVTAKEPIVEEKAPEIKPPVAAITPAKPTVTVPEAKPAVEEVVETDEKLSGITKRRRTRLVKEIAEEIKQDDIYQSELEAIGYKEGEVGVGFYYVPEKFRSEVEDITGKVKGFPTKLQRMFTFNPHEGATDWTKAFWKEIEAEGDVRGEYVDMDISDFVQRVKDTLEEKKKVGTLSARGLEAVRESQNPYTNYKITKFEMLRDGYSADEIDDMTFQWAEEYGIDLDTLDTEWVGAEPRKLKDIKQITDEAKQDEALEVLARENILKQERTEAKNTVREVLKANDVEAEVKEVEEIEPEDEIPFEVRGRPTGAAITQGEREVVLLAYGADSRTGYHEGYHILRRRLTERDTKVLDKHFKGNEEAEARSFAEFAKTNKTKPFLKGVWQKLINILRRIKSSLQGRGYRSVEDIFGEIQRGKIAKGARVPGVAYDTGVFGQPIEEQLRLPFKERQAAIKKVVLQEAKAKIAKRKARTAKPTILSGYPEVEYKFTGEWRKMELGSQSRVARRNRAIAEVPVYKSDEGKSVFDMTQQVIIKPYRRGRKAEPPTKKPYEEWRPKGRVPIKAKLIKEVDAEIARTMKPRSNTVQTTPEEIDRKLSGLFGTADLFYNPTNSLPEIQEAFAQLVRGGPLFDIRYEIREPVPVFYSKLERLLNQKMPLAMQADQMKSWLKKQGIKAEEMEWSGLDTYIDYVLTEGKTKADRRVTKQQALDTIAANNIQIEEVEKLAKRPVKGVPFVEETDETKFRQYTLPGGEDYKELLLRLPLPEAEKYTVKKSGSGWAVFNPNDAKVSSVLNKEAAEEQAHHLSSTALRTRGYKTAHWEETNVLAHVRFNNRTDSEGNKILFIEEIQSDWHQKGRKEGYGYEADIRRKIVGERVVWQVYQSNGVLYSEENTQHAAKEVAKSLRQRVGVPDAPFKKTWHELALKRMLRYAAENGYDKIAWTTGEQQAERYDLSKLIESVNVIKGKAGISLTVTTKEGRNVIDSKLVQPNELDNIIGKELADKIRQQTEPEHTYSGLDLKVGGEGMKSFYDRMVPQFLNKYAKKWGGRVGTTKIKIPPEVSKLPWQVFADNELYDAFRTREQATEFIDSQKGTIQGLGGEELKLELVFEGKLVPETVPSLELTPSLKKSVMAGQVMYEIPTHKLIADVERKARVKAEKARLKAIVKPKKGPKIRRINLKIRDVTPVLREDMKPLEVPLAKEPLKGSHKPPYFSDAWYEENIKKQRTDWLRKLGSVGRRAFLTGEKILTSSSTRLYNIHPELFRQTRRYIYDVLTRTAAMNDVMQPFLRGARRMGKIDRKQLDLAFKNSDRRKITELVVKHKLENEYAQARDVLDEIFDAAKEVGIDIEYQRDYWHRHIKDPQGFLEYFQKGDDWSIIDQAIRRRAKQAGRKAEELTDDEKAQVVNTLIRGFRTQALILSRPGAAKERTVDVVWKDIDQFYDGFETSILKYIKLMNAKIAEREFFGRETKEIQGLRKTQSARLTRLIKLKKRKGLRPDIKEPEYKEHISKTYGDWQAGNERLERLTARSPKDTIGGYVYDLVRQGQIQPSQERQIQDILTGIFAPKGMGWGMGLVSTGIYLDTLNSPIQALTQLDEFAYAFYRSPLHSIPVAIRTAFRMSKIKPEDIGIKSIGVEFHDPSMKKALTVLLKSTGFELVDRLNKENYINTILNKYQAQARSKTEKPALVKRLARVFGKDYKSVLEDLKKPIKSLDDVSDNVKYLLLNEILDIQPVAVSEMPEAYNKAGNLRILYTLKTFYIKRLDFMRNECFKDMKSPKTFLRGFSKLVWLAFSFALFGAGSDFLKDWVKGRTFDLMDSLVDNMLRMVMSSKFQVTQTQKEGFGRAVLEQWVPPTKIVDEISKDVITVAKGKDRGFEIWRSVPLVGELYYWWFGRGREKIEAKEGKKIGSRPTKPTKPIELRKPTRPTR